MKKVKINKNYKIKRISPKNQHYFFGYYGISPWSVDEKYLLGLRVPFIDKHPKKTDKAEIILFDLQNNASKKITETKAWNWQQGCMLQWMPPDYNEKIIFNDRRKGRFVSIIYNIKKNKEEKVILMPIYSLHPSGKYALSLNFARLNCLRKGYGYQGIKDEFKDEKSPDKEGVYLINIKTGKSKLVLSLKQLYGFNHISSMNKGKHWIDQPVFSPDGKRFCFLHRWYINNELFHTRFFTADLNGKSLCMFPDSGFYSHFTWKNPREILVWCSVSEKLREIRKGDKKSKFILEKILPFYRKIVPLRLRKKILPANYYLIEDKTKKIKKINLYHEDGHPSFSPDENYIITDTYPNSKHYRKLILYDLEKDKRIILGEFFTLPNRKYLSSDISNKNYVSWDNSPFRIDLHPRWNWQGNKACFDSVHEGFRGIYIVELEKG